VGVTRRGRCGRRTDCGTRGSGGGAHKKSGRYCALPCEFLQRSDGNAMQRVGISSFVVRAYLGLPREGDRETLRVLALFCRRKRRKMTTYSALYGARCHFEGGHATANRGRSGHCVARGHSARTAADSAGRNRFSEHDARHAAKAAAGGRGDARGQVRVSRVCRREEFWGNCLLVMGL